MFVWRAADPNIRLSDHPVRELRNKYGLNSKAALIGCLETGNNTKSLYTDDYEDDSDD